MALNSLEGNEAFFPCMVIGIPRRQYGHNYGFTCNKASPFSLFAIDLPAVAVVVLRIAQTDIPC